MSSTTNDGRLLVADSADHAAWLWVTNIIGLILVVLTACYRVLQRRKAWTWDSWDDHIAVLAFVFALLYYAILFPALRLGLGKASTSDNEADILHAAQYAFASRILAAFTACASQCSVTMTLARIVHVRRNSWICASTMGLSVFCLLIVLLVTGAGCPSDSPVAGIRNDKCATLAPRMIAIAVLEIINELIPLGLSVYFFWDLQMSRERRWNAVVGYACRLSNVALFAIIASLSISFARSGTTSIGIVPVLTVQGILVVCEFLCVIAIYLARAMNDFATAGPEITLSSAKDNSSGRHGKSNTVISTRKMKGLRSDTSGVQATVTHGPSSDADSDSSQRGIVKKVEYDVSSEDPGQQVRQQRSQATRSIHWEEMEMERR